MGVLFDEALCIRQWDWSETSQVVTLLCRRLGMVRGLAKGSRRPKHPYSGGIEPLTLGQAGVIIRPNSELALITEWDLSEPLRHVRQDWGVFLAATYLADLVQHFVRDHDPHPVVFDRVTGVLRAMTPGEPAWAHLLAGAWSVLVEAGFKPVLDRDVVRDEPLARSHAYAFVPEAGGLSALEAEGTRAPSGWGVRHATVEALRWVEHETDSPAAHAGFVEGELRPGVEACERACRLLAVYARHLLGSEPPSHRPLFGLDAASGVR